MIIIDCLKNVKLKIDANRGIIFSDARGKNVKVYNWEEIAKILENNKVV